MRILMTGKAGIIIILISWTVFCQTLPAGKTDSNFADILQTYSAEESTSAAVEVFFRDAAKQYEGSLDLLYERLREGLIKQAGTEAIISALRQRLQAMKEAQRIMTGKRTGRSREEGLPDLIRTLVHALGSGMPPEIFEDLLHQQRRLYLQRMQAVIEAGERMHLAGIEMDYIRLFMLDCRERQLRRGEILRGAQFWIDRREEGMDNKAIIAKLKRQWDSAFSADDNRPPRRRRQKR